MSTARYVLSAIITIIVVATAAAVYAAPVLASTGAFDVFAEGFTPSVTADPNAEAAHYEFGSGYMAL
jgi:hypothetical protein